MQPIVALLQMGSHIKSLNKNETRQNISYFIFMFLKYETVLVMVGGNDLEMPQPRLQSGGRKDLPKGPSIVFQRLKREGRHIFSLARFC